MHWLECSVSDGVFSRERLIQFTAASGEEYAAFVDASLVHAEGATTWVDVTPAGSRESELLVALPTMDGTRVWVPSESVRLAG